jgi:magnesium chelatase subunit D
MRQTKAAILSLLVDAHQKRDRVGLITFGRGGARLVLAPTHSVRVAASRLEDLPIGGATPLAAGLQLALRVIASLRRKDRATRPVLLLLTDGRGNVPLAGTGDPQTEALVLAAQFAEQGIDGLVVDTEVGPIRLGLARRLAVAWGVECRGLDELAGPRLSDLVRRALFHRAG